ncbi:hypothetical protein FKM82_003025 [Ascaphus truei]
MRLRTQRQTELERGLCLLMVPTVAAQCTLVTCRHKYMSVQRCLQRYDWMTDDDVRQVTSLGSMELCGEKRTIQLQEAGRIFEMSMETGTNNGSLPKNNRVSP